MHTPVLLRESVDALFAPQVPTDAVLVDGTFGRGGHARAILEKLGPGGRLIAFDRDPSAIAAAREIADPRFEIIHAPFSQMVPALRARGVERIHGALFDLGVSSPQLDESARGFSFMRDGPLDMRMDSSSGETASEWLARIDESTLAEVIKEYGEERFARSIAQAISAACRARPLGKIERTSELAEIVAKAVRTRERGQHPATRTFQAIRIAVNRELDELNAMLEAVGSVMSPGARLAVISFHSLEDRIVKRFMMNAAHPERALDPALKRLPILASQLPKANFMLVGKSAIASDAEIEANPRARSARLRVLEKHA